MQELDRVVPGAPLAWEAHIRLQAMGAHGIAGGAIYFAQSARETEWKWEGYMKDKDGNPLPGSKQDGVVLECDIYVGNSNGVGREPKTPRL